MNPIYSIAELRAEENRTRNYIEKRIPEILQEVGRPMSAAELADALGNLCSPQHLTAVFTHHGKYGSTRVTYRPIEVVTTKYYLPCDHNGVPTGEKVICTTRTSEPYYYGLPQWRHEKWDALEGSVVVRE